MKPLIVLGILAAAIFLMRDAALLPDGRTHLSFLDIGQGDSALITTKTGEQIIIDGGRDLATLEKLAEHMPYFDRTIDLLVLSHPNEDHLASFIPLLERYNIRAALIAPVKYDLPRFTGMLTLLRDQKIPVITAEAGKRITLSNLTLDVLWPRKGFDADDVNDLSVVLRIHDGRHSALFTGDMEERAERALLQTPEFLQSDILKVAHHGSKTSTSTGFLLAVAPSLSVISVGRENPYGHPSLSVVERLKGMQIAVWRTDTQGPLEVVWE